MKSYAVIDTNVLVSALLSTNEEAAMETVVKFGISIEPTHQEVQLPDMKDLPFYEVVMEKRVDDAYLVTGNIKHFPKRTYIVTARQMLDILEQNRTHSH